MPFELNLKNLFQDFNPSKFVVFGCLLFFSLLLALRLDGTIGWSYWVVFLPIWIWKFLVINGAIVGSWVWCCNPQYRIEGDSYTQYKAMIICTAMHLLLLMFEVLSCIKLEHPHTSLRWILVFIPLIVMSIISIGVCIWAVKHERTFELELFCSVNILQFIFLALKLDRTINWAWVIVFIPIWIVMCVALVGVLYAIILAIILLKSPNIIPEQRRGNMFSAVGYTCLVIPLLVFQILLANKGDGLRTDPYIAITIPLFISLITLMCMAFGTKGGNHWWFGIRKDFCPWLLAICPVLQEYGNISYKLPNGRGGSQQAAQPGGSEQQQERETPPLGQGPGHQPAISHARQMASAYRPEPLEELYLKKGRKPPGKDDASRTVVPVVLIDTPD